MSRRGRRRGRTWLLAAALLFAVAALAGLAAGWYWIEQPHRGWDGAEVIVTIEPGWSVRRILAALEDRGVVRSADAAYLRWRLGGDTRPLRAGEYRFDRPLPARAVLDKLARGEVITYPLTVIEGLTLDETVSAVVAAGFGDEAALTAAVRDPGLIRDLDPAARDLEGYLHPDTYQFARGTNSKEIVATLVRTFRQRFAAEVRPLLGPMTPSPREVVILASIVEKEAALAAERPLVAAVYRNRLDRGIGLYADPTIIYALKLAGRWDGNLRRADLALDSPYNTYRVGGLPPGPICSPGLPALLAAARPADVPYLYFVSRNDGSHVFAATLAEHNRNVERWQRRYWRERWAAERRR